MPSTAAWLAIPENQEKLKISRKKWKDKNKEKVLEKQRQARENNRETFNVYHREYYKLNREARMKYINAHRRNRVKFCTPPWADKKEIRKFYAQCPAGFHVDHIIPLHGKIVSGLHVLDNLQYLPAVDNLKKNNVFVQEVF